HPGRTASIFVDGANIGYMGEFHPETRARFKIDERAYAIVVEMDALYGFSSGVKKAFKPLPKFPATLRDIALKVKNETTAAEIEETIRKSAGQFLTGLKLFDVYQGKQIEDGYKSLAYSLTFRAADRTLSESDVAGPMDRILRDLSEKLEATLRDK
ncbi:MAG: phenylalanine--tRNA ligase subunit beta, partial [Defluviitaleaceae bacterium]|nr:phenylalanine--tRNA ligase subunit beta [Defluviitaleaceae bacterium]